MPKSIQDLIRSKNLTKSDQKLLKQYGINSQNSLNSAIKKLKSKLNPPTSTTIPTITSSNSTSNIEHEASTSKVSEDILWYAKTRGLKECQTTSLVVSGFTKSIIQNLPMEFMVETRNLIREMIDVDGVG
jgi:SUF system FeS cluster assembly, SufBD